MWIMAIADIADVVSPPDAPVELGDAARIQTVEAALGIRLPADYHDFAMRFGSGVIRDGSISIEVLNPCAAHYLTRVATLCCYFREVKASARGHDLPHAAFPTIPGLLPWGRDDNGNDLSWLTRGECNEWPVVVRAEGYTFQTIDLPMTTFLARNLKREMKSILWEQEGFFPNRDRITFVPQALGMQE